MLSITSTLELGQNAPGFVGLLGVDGRRYSLDSFNSKPILVLIFISNGCPTVKAAEDRVKRIQTDYSEKGVQIVAINSNNSFLSPADTYDEMVIRSKEKGFNFPYLKDEERIIARACVAICTPHVFVFDSDRRLRYRGRIDDSRDPAKVMTRDLNNALEDLIGGREVRTADTKPFGCSIVW